MAETPHPRLILIVTGSALRAEEVDRPLAYYLKQRLENELSQFDSPVEDRPMVVSDLRWLHDDLLQNFPTLSIGGPGVNLLAHRWLEELPLTLAVDDQYYIQMDPELEDLRVSIWGMDNPTTQIAVSTFINRFLPRYLNRCLAVEHDPIDLDDFD